MTKVFFGGSRRLSRLNAEIRARIDRVLQGGGAVVIGDANGADRAIQQYLTQKGYSNVTVFCAGVTCRNNLGHWNVEWEATDHKRPAFLHYARRDARMADQVDCGFFLWDGRSKGTLNSVVMLLKQGKPALVYLSPEKRFVTISHMDHLKAMIDQCEPQTMEAFRSVVRVGESVTVRQARLDLT